MRRPPLLQILLFVGIAILAAVLFHLWNDALSKDSNAAVDNATRNGWVESFESLAACSETQRPVARQIESFPPVFRQVRSRVSADLPRACVSFIMSRTTPEADSNRSYASCLSGTAQPQKQDRAPCRTESYVNSVYSLFGDVTSCLEVPQKDLVPRIFRESGFHFTAMRSQHQMGLGQMSPSTVARAERTFPEVLERIARSETESCRTLLPYLEKLPGFAKLATEKSTSCASLSLPQQPLRQLLDLAIRYQQDSVILERYLSRLDVDRLLRRSGLSSYEPEQLRQILMALSHRAGPATAVILMKNYLEYRMAVSQQENTQLTQADFDFSSRQPASAATAKTFVGYLSEFSSPEFADDLIALSTAAKTLNRTFKEGTCVPESYLSFSL